MNNYESIYILDQDLTEEDKKDKIEKFTSLVETSGELEEVKEWGKRRLAYPINFKNEGFYVLMNFKANADFPKELERQYKITEGIVRYLVVKKN